MKKNIKTLIEYLQEVQNDEVKISFFKEKYDPLDLATKLKNLEQCDLIEIDWDRKMILKKFSTEKLLSKKNSLNRKKILKPDYLNGTEIEINKPYI
ncbi:hypothetical protein ACKGJN_15800 [Gillisia sp. Q332]|uniref:hypothetical protein n=1 Tax=Gillisia xinjiangensis TaxID=3384765 RepID=UPI003919DEC1